MHFKQMQTTHWALGVTPAPPGEQSYERSATSINPSEGLAFVMRDFQDLQETCLNFSCGCGLFVCDLLIFSQYNY